MSAHLFTDAQVQCDAPGCAQAEHASTWLRGDSTVVALRRELRLQGWTVFVAGPEPGRRLDFCPEHKP